MKKIFIVSLLFIIIVSIFYTSFGFQIGTQKLKLLKQCEVYIKHNNIDQNVPFVVYQKDGRTIYPAYCVDPQLHGIGYDGTPEYSIVGDTKLNNEVIWKTLINGYPYKSIIDLNVHTEEEAYTATKLAVYAVMFNRNTSEYSAVNTDAGRRTFNAFLKIVNDARNSKEVLKDNNKISIISNSEEWKTDEINNNYVSKSYSIKSLVKNGEYGIEINGNLPEGSIITNMQNNEQNIFKINESFKILTPINNLADKGSFSIIANANIETKPIVYGKSTIADKQSYAISGFMLEETQGVLEENTLKNITKIEVIKKEYGTEKRLAGVKFNLLDSNKNILKENLITNENGEIVIDMLKPGKYYLQEIETLEEYNLYKDLIEIDIKFNEEVEVIVNNTLKSVSEISNNVDIIEVTQNSTETLYNVDKETTYLKNNEVKKLPVTGY